MRPIEEILSAIGQVIADGSSPAWRILEEAIYELEQLRDLNTCDDCQEPPYVRVCEPCWLKGRQNRFAEERRLTADNDRLRKLLESKDDVLRWLNKRGGMGEMAHEKIDIALELKP